MPTISFPQTPQSSSRSYNAGYTEDIHQAVTTIAARFPESPLFLVGFSLGANLMVSRTYTQNISYYVEYI